MKPLHQAWDSEKLSILAKTYNTKKEFYTNNYNAYQAAQRLGIYESISKHMPNNNGH